jgi:hypothetical protein
VSFELALVEAVLEELRQQVFVLRQRHHAITDVAGRKDIELVPKAPGRAAVVCNGDYCDEFADGMVLTMSLSF